MPSLLWSWGRTPVRAGCANVPFLRPARSRTLRIPDNAYSGDAENVQLGHEMPLRRMTSPPSPRPGHRDVLFEARWRRVHGSPLRPAYGKTVSLSPNKIWVIRWESEEKRKKCVLEQGERGRFGKVDKGLEAEKETVSQV